MVTGTFVSRELRRVVLFPTVPIGYIVRAAIAQNVLFLEKVTPFGQRRATKYSRQLTGSAK